jgi:hypothetical protein
VKLPEIDFLRRYFNDGILLNPGDGPNRANLRACGGESAQNHRKRNRDRRDRMQMTRTPPVDPPMTRCTN